MIKPEAGDVISYREQGGDKYALVEDVLGGLLHLSDGKILNDTYFISIWSPKKHKRVEPFQVTWHNDVIQGTPKWLELREGLITASKVEAIMVNELGKRDEYLTITPQEKSGEFSKGALTYLNKKVDEKRGIGTGSTQKKTEAMEWGNLMESRSRKAYEKATGKKVWETGIVTCDLYNIAVSPDGQVKGEKILTEIKNYGTKKVNKVVETGKIPKDAYLQMQEQLLVTDYDACDFILTDYHDEAKYEYTCWRVERDEELIQVMKDKLIKGSTYIDKKVEEDEAESIDWLTGTLESMLPF